MREQLSFVCVNCGTMLEAPEGATGVICPVCQFYNDFSVTESMALTPDALEAQLGDLIGRARTSGMTMDDIVRVLRDELEFAAELASGGRHLYVQILDLGPLEAQGLKRPVRDRGALLRGRSVAG